MAVFDVAVVAATLAALFWVPGLRRMTLGVLPPHSHIHANRLTLAGWIAAVLFCAYAIRSGARLDYGPYLIQWQMVLDANAAPWGEHSLNAYGPLYNLLALFAWVDPFLPKCLFVGVWVWLSVYIAAETLRHSDNPRAAYTLVLGLLCGPFFIIQVGHYGFFDILPAALCLLAVHLRLRGRDGWSGAALAAAVLLKYYPLAMLPFLMLDGRRINWKPGIWCVGVIGLGMLASYAVWGGSTLYPLGFATDRPSKWLSIFRYLRGPYSPLALFTDAPNADGLSMPAMLVFGGGVWLWCWLNRVPLLPACIAGLATGLQFYKVGHVQFQAAVLLLIAYSAATGGLLAPRRRGALIASTAYFLWLTGFVAVYAVLRRVSREGMLESFRDFAGLIGLAMTLWLVLPMLTFREDAGSGENPG